MLGCAVFLDIILASELQPLNANSPIEVTLLPIVMLVSDLQPENASVPIEVTLSGMIQDVLPQAGANATNISSTIRQHLSSDENLP